MKSDDQTNIDKYVKCRFDANITAQNRYVLKGYTDVLVLNIELLHFLQGT